MYRLSKLLQYKPHNYPKGVKRPRKNNLDINNTSNSGELQNKDSGQSPS